MKLFSSAFKPGETIPSLYTCDSDDISPPLSWSDLPSGTASLALISDDPDAPRGWVHWIIFNIPAASQGLEKGIKTDRVLPDGSVQGRNDFRRTGYGGPCPPGGTHRYYFRLYALDTLLEKSEGITKTELLEKMKGHILAEAELMGRYSRS
jgi:Raf kinase inhibitor-like YbhB/YbcL family protein